MMVSEPTAKTVGELRKSGYQVVSVREEIRNNLMDKIRAEELVFPGIVGFDETVIPQLENAILAGHDVILLGERGQAKSKLIPASPQRRHRGPVSRTHAQRQPERPRRHSTGIGIRQSHPRETHVVARQRVLRRGRGRFRGAHSALPLADRGGDSDGRCRTQDRRPVGFATLRSRGRGRRCAWPLSPLDYPERKTTRC